jgi:hypothetical protein
MMFGPNYSYQRHRLHLVDIDTQLAEMEALQVPSALRLQPGRPAVARIQDDLGVIELQTAIERMAAGDVTVPTFKSRRMAIARHQIRLGIPALQDRIKALAATAAAYDPMTDLGSDALAYWDIDDSARITLVSGAISAWTDRLNSYSMTQGTAAARPAFNATGLNGKPCATFDGGDDALACTTAGLLTLLADGAEEGEMWFAGAQDAAASDASQRYVMAQGSANLTGRYLGRNTAGGGTTVTSAVRIGVSGATVSSATAATINMIGAHVVRGVIRATEVYNETNGRAGTTIAGVPVTVNTRIRLGAAGLSSANAFWQGRLMVAAWTKVLSTAKAARFTYYLQRRL